MVWFGVFCLEMVWFRKVWLSYVRLGWVRLKMVRSGFRFTSVYFLFKKMVGKYRREKNSRGKDLAGIRHSGEKLAGKDLAPLYTTHKLT